MHPRLLLAHLQEHPLRQRLNIEFHAGPPVPLVGATLVSHLVFQNGEGAEAGDDERAILAELCKGLVCTAIENADSFLTLETAAFRMRWERHTEFSSYTFFRSLAAGEVPVGAVVVSGRRVLARAGNRTRELADPTAHAEMLAAQGVIAAQDLADIRRGMAQIVEEIEAGRFEWKLALEDVHLNIEARLTELVGDAGKRLHTGRSRNDQVATDVRLWLVSEIDVIDSLLTELQRALVDVAAKNVDVILPGFTHLQVAQPVSFGHHMLAYVEMFKRDAERMADVRRRTNVLPLGFTRCGRLEMSHSKNFRSSMFLPSNCWIWVPTPMPPRARPRRGRWAR